MSKVALVCGGTSGIGKAALGLLIAEGWTTINLARTAGEQVQAGHSAWSVDLTDPKRTTEVVDMVGARHGQIDAVVHTVGDIYEPASLDDLDWERWKKSYDVCVGTAVNIARATLPYVRPRSGAYVFISSVAALRPYHGIADYCAAKAALDNFVKSLAADEAKHNVRANSILPAVVDTPLFARSIFTREQAAAWHALGRIGTPEEVAAMAVNLIGGSGSWITGQAIVMDGGMMLPQ
jgi:NAD(P)-dependent dehydrogenase (short-subunit alcohol dehydrogenase family)